MKRVLIASVIFLAVIVWTGQVIAEIPTVIKSTPDNGVTDVAVDVGRIIIVFDRNMKMNSWSLTISEKGPFPPMIQEDEPWIDPLTFELRVRRLKPETTYAIQLNSKRRKGFMSAENQISLPVTTITFTTTSEESKISSQHMSSKVSVQKQTDAVLPKPGEHAAAGEKQEMVGSRAKKTAGTDTPIQKKDQDRLSGNATTSALIKASKGKAGGKAGNIFLKLYREQYQGAFYMLIPKGWKAEGGMIPSGVQWNVVDLVENNIRFRVTSPDGKSFFGWYPRFYFQDPAVHMQSSGGLLRPQIGGVLNGCWIYPYMGVAQYVQYIIFGQLAAQELQNPRIIGRAVESPELRPWLPQMAQRKECGYVNFECTIGGTPMYGRIYTLVYDLGTIWSTVGTFGWIAPKSRWKEDERIMELCIRSFRLNPKWVRRAAAAQQKRGEKYGQVIREMQGIDNEINRNRSQTRSDIQEEFYKVITEQIETFDLETGDKKRLPMYNNAWTNGRGDYVLKDYDDGTLPVEDPTEWRKLKIINRNDPNYQPEKYGD
jgi:hypothetical protein